MRVNIQRDTIYYEIRCATSLDYEDCAAIENAITKDKNSSNTKLTLIILVKLVDEYARMFEISQSIKGEKLECQVGKSIYDTIMNESPSNQSSGKLIKWTSKVEIKRGDLVKLLEDFGEILGDLQE